MQRWLIILGLAMVQIPNLAAAAPARSSDIPFWKRLLSVFTPNSAPAARPVPHEHVRTRAVAAPISPEPVPAPPIHEHPTKSTDTGCDGGQRVISAYYWEGRHTASGQPFNPHGMTAAHRTLPFGTRLTVTNPRTGQSVDVVINDRGPFVSGVSLDLSLGAAQAIGLHGTGSVCISS
jgi:rare lipoprotein A